MGSASHDSNQVLVYELEKVGTLASGSQLMNTLSALTEQQLKTLCVRGRELLSTNDYDGLGSVEVAVLTMACLVFLGAFIAVLCICCIKMKRYVIIY